LLKRISPRAVTATPFARHGPPPTFKRSRDYGEMVSAIADEVGELQTLGMTTIGILSKTSVDAQKLHTSLRKVGLADLGLVEREKSTLRECIGCADFVDAGA
jgi:DNA helicase IV